MPQRSLRDPGARHAGTGFAFLGAHTGATVWAIVAGMSDTTTISVEAQGHVLLIGLDRAHKKNAFTVQMLRELSEAYTRLQSDDSLWCGYVYAHGGSFTAGLDLAEVGPRVASGDQLFPESGVDPLDLRPPRRTKPVVMAVQGYCFTIGIELLLAADIRVAASDTIFAQMEVARGIMPFGGATLRFPAVCGWGNAMRWMLTGERFDAAEALRMGLVQETVPPAELFERGLALTALVADQAPLAVQATRHNSRVAAELGPGHAKEQLMDAARSLFASEDAREGVMSFVERRRARFKGQ